MDDIADVEVKKAFVLNGDCSGRAAVILPMGQLRLLSLNENVIPKKNCVIALTGHRAEILFNWDF